MTVSRRPVLLALAAVLCLGVGLLVAVVARSHGYAARHVELSNGGVWVSSDHDGLVGRVNLPVGALDAATAPPGGTQQNVQLEVAQDGGAVVARDRAAGELYPVDPATATVLGDAGVPFGADEQVSLGGGTLAAYDPASGKIWALRYQPATGVTSVAGLGGKATPVGRLPASSGQASGGALAVGTDGTVHAVAGNGRLATITQTRTGLAKVRYSQLHASLRTPQLTAIGARVVAFDAATGVVLLPGGHTATLRDVDAGALLQAPGPDASRVVVATSRGLYGIALSGGAVRTLASVATGAPAVPQPLGDCVYAAWVGTPGPAVRSCDGNPANPIRLQDSRAVVQPQIEVNHGTAVLNDVTSGAVWDLQSGHRVDNWALIKPPTTVKPQPDTKHPSNQVGTVAAPPRAIDDVLGARPGRTATLHVLDNDSDPSGGILSITTVSAPDNPDATLQIAPDGQTVQIAMPAGASAVHFRYTVNDTKNLQGSAEVTVQAHPFGTNRAPNLRPGFMPRVWAVAAGGRLSLPVLGDWRDADGDPPVLASATATGGTVSTTPDGRVNYIAGVAAGTGTITYTVTDGMAGITAVVNLTVLAVTSAQIEPATANPDVARGQVGQPLVIRPLDNDLPGADPTNPDAQLALATQVAQPDGTTVTTDLKAGTVTFTATRAATFVLSYSVAFGNAAYARGSIRVDITPPATKADKPIAVLDTAVLHSQHPDVVDVLQNDFDPAGRLLVVESAAAQDGDLQVAIIQGRYLRLLASRPTLSPSTQIVNYTITDGVSDEVTGQVSVSQLPDPPQDTPVPADDTATVRAQDSVSVPVLDNDVDPAGDTLSLAQNVDGAPTKGQLPVSGTAGGPAGGQAYVSGDVVRYVAPAVTTEQHYTIDYVVQNTSGNDAVGHVLVTVEPPPTAAHPDQSPTPPEVDARVVAGDTVNLPIRTSGADPDGDAVTLVGIGSAPQLGRILSTTAGFLRYQAFPTSAGTDSFSYTVTDRYGKTGSAALRVAVVAPGDPQPPIASDIAVNAAPNSTVSIDVLTHVYRSPDDVVSVDPLARTNAGDVAARATLLSPTGPVRVKVGSGLAPTVVRYTVQDGLSDPSTATITVRPVAGIDLPPVAVDAFATPARGQTDVTVDPLAADSDPDAPAAGRAALHLTRVFDPAARIVGDRIALPILDHPQIVPYEVADAGGATAVASIFVPAPNAGPPTAVPGQLVQVDKNGSRSIAIASYARDPAGKPLLLTTAQQISTAPADGLRVQADGTTGLVLVAQHGYVGPASVTFQVTDGTSLTDPNGQFGVITVPVQVGPETPVLRCPTDQIPVVQGSASLSLDVASLCHVWVADPAQLDTLQYTPRWTGDPPPGVDLSGFGTSAVGVTAAGSARPGEIGSVTIGVGGSPDATPGVIGIVVRGAAPPTVAPVTVDALVAGRSRSIDMADYVSSPLRDSQVTIVAVSEVSGLPATSPTSGSQVTITPAASAHGTLVFSVTVSDVVDRTQVRRQVTGLITVHVLGVPDAPTGVAPDRTVLSHSVVLSWNAPDNNGVPIDHYEVDWDGGQHDCPASPCTIGGLHNGEPYQFTVRAHNGVGFSPPSGASPTTVPNAVPSAPTNLTTADPEDGRLTVAWNPAAVDGTPVLRYVLSWPGGRVVTSSTSATATGLDNDARTTFQVVAVNLQGAGPAASTTGQSAGTPQYPAPPAQPGPLPAAQVERTSDLGDRAAVTVTVPDIDPNGPGPTTYSVTRTDAGGSTSTPCTIPAGSRSCVDGDVPYNGSTYTYTYTAANATGHRSASSAPATFVARGTPDGVSNASLTGTGQDGQATLTFDEGAVNDSAARVSCYVGDVGGTSCGDFALPGPGAHPGVRELATNLPDGPSTSVTLVQYNTVGTASQRTASASAAVFGQLETPTITPAAPGGGFASGPNVDFTVGWNPHGGRVKLTVTVTAPGFDPYTKDLTPGDTDNQTHTVTFSDQNPDNTLGTPISVGSDEAPVSITVQLTDQSGYPRPGPAQAAATTQTGHVTAAVGRGAACGGNDANCAHIHVQLSGFQTSGSVPCQISPDGQAPFTVSVDVSGGAASKDLSQTYDTPGGTVQISCENVSSRNRW